MFWFFGGQLRGSSVYEVALGPGVHFASDANAVINQLFDETVLKPVMNLRRGSISSVRVKLTVRMRLRRYGVVKSS